MDDWNEITYTRARYKKHSIVKEEEKNVLFMPKASRGIL
jgi:hypothetical protein